MKMAGISTAVARGWRESLRTGRVYRRLGGYVAIVSAADPGFSVTLRRNDAVQHLEDALAIANHRLEQMRETDD